MKRREEEDSRPIIRPLKSILPAGEENALAAIDRFLEAVKGHSQVDGIDFDGLREWFAIQLEAEYRGIRRNYYELEQQKRREERAAARKAARAREKG